MKKWILLLISVIGTSAFAQVAQDTLFMTDGQKVACKLVEVGEYEMRYRIGGADGTVFVVDKYKVRKYVLSNGYSEILRPDELSVEHEHGEIINSREVIKIHPFGIGFNHVSLAYEKVLKVGMNLDVQAGYINSSISPGANGILNVNHFHTGAYIKPGLKFFKGSDYVVRGMKYAHPLKGSYIKIDLAFSYLKFENIQTEYYVVQPAYNPTTGIYSPATMSTVSTDVTSVSYGGFVNFGRQTILGNLFTLDVYGGFGFTSQSNTYSNKDYKSTLQSSNGYYGYYNNYMDERINNYYGWWRVPRLGLSFTAGLRLGFIIPAKKGVKTKVTQ